MDCTYVGAPTAGIAITTVSYGVELWGKSRLRYHIMILLADNLSNLIATFPMWWDGSCGDRVGPAAVIEPKRRCHRLPALALVSEVRYHKYNVILDAEICELWIGSHKYSVAKLSLFHCSRCARIKFVRAAVHAYQ